MMVDLCKGMSLSVEAAGEKKCAADNWQRILCELTTLL